MKSCFAAVAVLALFVAGNATAQERPARAADCAATDAALPAYLAGWMRKTDVQAAENAGSLGKAALPIGQAVTLALYPTRQVSYVMQPEKPGGAVAHGGMASLHIDEPGTYQVSLGAGPWIDIVKDGMLLVSSAHAPGPKCSTIGKTVQFPLQAGDYVVQLSANAAPNVVVMVSKVP